ncbi:hypothetical protein J19TS1_00410 [Heyndrickxia oleronia]|nr:hypothetical protein J19TS1_00410 [Heyndrickxia oleronia]
MFYIALYRLQNENGMIVLKDQKNIGVIFLFMVFNLKQLYRKETNKRVRNFEFKIIGV